MSSAVVPISGEVLPDSRGRLTPAELSVQVEEIKELMRSVLAEGVDYGLIPGTTKPTLWRSGAEWLLKWARLGHRNQRVEIERDADGRPYGATYRCEVYLLDQPEVVIASAEGYCGYDEPEKEAHKTRNGKPIPRAPWNTIVQMAQKRALVAATKAATAASGLFAQDVEMDPDESFRELGWESRAAHDEWRDTVTARAKALDDKGRVAFREWSGGAGFVWAQPTSRAFARQVDDKLAKLAPAAGGGGPAPAGAATAEGATLCGKCGEPIGADGQCGCPF